MLFCWLLLFNFILILINQKLNVKADKNIINNIKATNISLILKISLNEKIFTINVTLNGIFKKTKIVSQPIQLNLVLENLLIKNTIKTI